METRFVMLGSTPDFSHHYVDVDNNQVGASVRCFRVAESPFAWEQGPSTT